MKHTHQAVGHNKLSGLIGRVRRRVNLRTVNSILFLLGLALFGFLLWAPIKASSYDSLQIVNTSKLTAGGQINYKMHVCRHVNEGVRTDVLRSLVSTSNTNLQPIPLSADTTTGSRGCRTVERSLSLPYNIPAGWYKLRIIGTYAVLPIRTPSVVSIESGDVYISHDATQSVSSEIQSDMRNLQMRVDAFLAADASSSLGQEAAGTGLSSSTNQAARAGGTSRPSSTTAPASSGGQSQSSTPGAGGSSGSSGGGGGGSSGSGGGSGAGNGGGGGQGGQPLLQSILSPILRTLPDVVNALNLAL